jgi:diguanylate cyclase (GGDEF)-like protein
MLDSGVEIHVTVSVGGAAARTIRDPEAGKKLLAAADAALYRAKENGRNRVEMAAEVPAR